MFGKNKYTEKQRFSIKKYSFGVTSALVGVFLASGANVADAQEVVKAEQTTATASQQKLTQAKTDADAKLQATNQKITETKTVVTETQTKVTQLQAEKPTAVQKIEELQATNTKLATEVKELEAQVPAKQGADQTAQTEVTTAKAKETEASQAVSKAQTAVTTKQAQIDKVTADLQSVNNVDAELASAKKLVETNKVNVTKAQTEYDNAVKSNEVVAKERTEVSNQLATENEKLKSATDTENQLKSQKLEADKKLSELNDKLNNSEIPTFTASAEYVQALKEYAPVWFPRTEEDRRIREQAIAKLKKLNDEELAKNIYKGSEEDKNIVFDLNGTKTIEIQNELTNYGAALVNSLRTLFGTTLVTSSVGAIDFADYITNRRFEDNYENGHYNAAINEYAKNDGLQYDTTNQVQYYENLAFDNYGIYTNKTSKISLYDAKRLIHEATKDFMFNGSEWNHAYSVVGLGSKNENQYFGIDLSQLSSVNTSIHFINVGESMILDKSKFDTTAVPNKYDQSDIAETTRLRTSQLELVKDLANKLQSATQNKNSISSTVGNLNKKLSSLGGVEVTSLLNALTKAKETLKLSEQNVADLELKKTNTEEYLAKAKEELTKLNAEKTVLNSNLAKTQEGLTKAEQEVSKKEAELEKVSQELKTLLKDIETKKSTIIENEKTILELSNIDTTISQLESQLEKLLAELTGLEKAKAEQEVAYKEATEKLTKFEEENKDLLLFEKTIKNTGVITENNKSVKSPKQVASKSTNRKATAKTKANVLPKTSATSNDTTLPAGLAAALVAAGLLVAKRRKED
ncbi:MAG: SEC10/PgrA surface exclusion domain-containing protein [Gemella sp.]|nr:SEC10/PgrA surface exclusion domain-containing protein [Gemella sp.]